MALNVCSNNAVAFAAIKRPILSRQKQWNDIFNPYQQMERRAYAC
jgi:hypothetical protein